MIKTTKFLFAGILGLSLLILSCTKEEEPEPIPDFLQCKIDGTDWKALKSLTGENNNGIIIINGVSHSDDTLRMLIADQESGTYPIKNTHNITILKTQGKTYVPLNSADGFLTIKTHDTGLKVIEGSFYFTADAGGGDWKEITGGSFKTVYQ